jgi:hypothetical protein
MDIPLYPHLENYKSESQEQVEEKSNMKTILALLLLTTLGMLVALPQLTIAGEHSPQSNQSNNKGTNEDTGQHVEVAHNETSDDHHENETSTSHHPENDDNHTQEMSDDHENETMAAPEQEPTVNATFHIPLVGSEQVGPVNTTAFGFAKIQLVQNSTLQFIRFRVVVCDIVEVIHSHIHVGAAGTNGDVIIHFFDQPTMPFNSTDGCSTLASGERGPADLMTSSKGGINSWSDFVHALLTGNTYVNVHTHAHPGGEIRGQILHSGEDVHELIEQGDAETGKDEELPHTLDPPIIFMALECL